MNKNETNGDKFFSKCTVDVKTSAKAGDEVYVFGAYACLGRKLASTKGLKIVGNCPCDTLGLKACE